MIITEMSLGTLSIPLKKPFRTALRSTDVVTTNIVALATDTGAVGYGEAPPTAAITGDTDGSIACTLATRIAPALLGRDVSELHDALTAVERS
ncbi:MAG: dipeptide epimerase, partial [Fretibacterium sp.]|nr:dipeptide epimerase [Fretibacterium sp.]